VTAVIKPLFSWRSLICDSDLDATARHVALTLSLHTNERGESCFPSLDTLASETARSKSTVSEAIRRLEETEWVTVNRPARQGRGHRTEYALAIPTESGPLQIGTLTEPSAENGTLSGRNGTDSPRNGTTAVPEDVVRTKEDVAPPATFHCRVCGGSRNLEAFDDDRFTHRCVGCKTVVQ
jgi:hypothetical protein